MTAAYIYEVKCDDPEQALVILSVPVILNAAKDLKNYIHPQEGCVNVTA